MVLDFVKIYGKDLDLNATKHATDRVKAIAKQIIGGSADRLLSEIIDGRNAMFETAVPVNSMFDMPLSPTWHGHWRFPLEKARQAIEDACKGLACNKKARRNGEQRRLARGPEWQRVFPKCDLLYRETEPRRMTLPLDGVAGQNDIFVLMKLDGGYHAKKYQMLQGYIAGARSPGYNLTSWLRSENKLAQPFDEQFLTNKLFRGQEKFLDNAVADDRKFFDGKMFASLFHADSRESEPFFNGRPYVATFRWREVDDSDIVGPGGQKKLVDQLTAKATTLTSSLFEVSATGSMSQVNF